MCGPSALVAGLWLCAEGSWIVDTAGSMMRCAVDRAHGVSAELLERERELEEIDALLEAASGGAGRLVLLEGSGGIGKTRLLDACAQLAGDHGIQVLRVQGDELAGESSFGAVRELLWEHAQAASADLLVGAAELARPVFALSEDGVVDGDRAGAVLHGLYWLVAGLADCAPLALLVDDAHWLDAPSARFLVYLARRIESLPVLVALALRRGEGQAPAGLDAAVLELGARVLQPAPLSADAVAVAVRGEWVRGRMRGCAGPAMRRRAATRSTYASW